MYNNTYVRVFFFLFPAVKEGGKGGSRGSRGSGGKGGLCVKDEKRVGVR